MSVSSVRSKSSKSRNGTRTSASSSSHTKKRRPHIESCLIHTGYLPNKALIHADLQTCLRSGYRGKQNSDLIKQVSEAVRSVIEEHYDKKYDSSNVTVMNSIKELIESHFNKKATTVNPQITDSVTAVLSDYFASKKFKKSFVEYCTGGKPSDRAELERKFHNNRDRLNEYKELLNFTLDVHGPNKKDIHIVNIDINRVANHML